MTGHSSQFKRGRISTARWLATCSAIFLLVTACGGGGGGGSTNTPAAPDAAQACRTKATQDEQLACFVALHGVTALEAPHVISDALFAAGRDLFLSKKLSGTGTVACVSCHANTNAGVEVLTTIDGIDTVRALHVSLRGGDPDDTANSSSIHRNAPDLVNRALGSPQSMFWDGRVAVDGKGGYITPAGSKLPTGLSSLLAAQALFPLLSREEMLGCAPGTNKGLSENASAALVSDSTTNPQPVWDAVMQRVRAESLLYGELQAAFPDVAPERLGIAHVANALAAFQTRRWNAAQSNVGFHGWLRDRARWPMSASELNGALLFFDKAGCAQCHSGPRLTDGKSYNLAIPQIGPGFGSGANETPRADKGRFEVTQQVADLYAFVTPSLWEVRATPPYFHNGVYGSLEQAVRHHLDAAGRAQAFRCSSDAPALQSGIKVECRDSLSAPALYADMLTRLAPEIRNAPPLNDAELADLIKFLKTLTDGRNGGGT